MNKFITLTSTCLPLRTENIDTDQIIPARFLKVTGKSGIGKHFFHNWRFDESGKEKQDSIFFDPKYKEAKILIAGNNFGCGSSREHAAWAILDFGLRAVISSSFGDIFYTNSLKNGLLPVPIKQDELDELLELIELEPQTKVTVDLENQLVLIPSASLEFTFPIDQFPKACLLNGVDELGYILSLQEKIKQYEKTHKGYIHHRNQE